MTNSAVIILAAVAILAIGGLVMTTPDSQGAAVARPVIGDECGDLLCPNGLDVAKIKQYNGYVYCACGSYQRGEPPETVFEYELRQGQWLNTR